jgi:hypothetical protein
LNVLKGFRTVENYLKRKQYKIAGQAIRVIKPQMLYEDRMKKKIYLATDFFEEGQVTQIRYMGNGKKKVQIVNAIEELRKVMEYKHDVLEIWPLNAFYSPSTDTVLLFDLQHFKY